MPFLGIFTLGIMFAGILYYRDERPDVARYAKFGIVIGAIGITLVGMAAMGPMAALMMFAAFVSGLVPIKILELNEWIIYFQL